MVWCRPAVKRLVVGSSPTRGAVGGVAIRLLKCWRSCGDGRNARPYYSACSRAGKCGKGKGKGRGIALSGGALLRVRNGWAFRQRCLLDMRTDRLAMGRGAGVVPGVSGSVAYDRGALCCVRR